MGYKINFCAMISLALFSLTGISTSGQGFSASSRILLYNNLDSFHDVLLDFAVVDEDCDSLNELGLAKFALLLGYMQGLELESTINGDSTLYHIWFSEINCKDVSFIDSVATMTHRKYGFVTQDSLPDFSTTLSDVLGVLSTGCKGSMIFCFPLSALDLYVKESTRIAKQDAFVTNRPQYSITYATLCENRYSFDYCLLHTSEYELDIVNNGLNYILSELR